MSAHTIILLVLAYAAVRAIFKRKPADPIQLTARSPETHAQIVSWHEQQHYTFAQRHTLNFDRPLPARVVAPIDYLAPYRPKLET